MATAVKTQNIRKAAFLRRINSKSLIEIHKSSGQNIKKYIKEFWTSKQRKGNSIHEISYRACFKSELPKYFIESLTNKGDIVYDPFMGRGTSIIEGALLGRQVIGNDINPLSQILVKPRLFIPELEAVAKRLCEIKLNKRLRSQMDLSMFFHPQTFIEILSLRNYIIQREKKNLLDDVDCWIRMVATNKLTGHSKNFFSIYTLPPNQAISASRQALINYKKKQVPPYKNVNEIILIKTKSLLSNINSNHVKALKNIGIDCVLLSKDARFTPDIPNNHVQLTITSPPFLNVIQYAQDNWLRCWFNGINVGKISKKITVTSSLKEWTKFMNAVMAELFRITKHSGYVAVEVGEIDKGKILLDEVIVELGIKNGFKSEGICINRQTFTKTAQIWGVTNNTKGTNSNRIVLFSKP